MDNNFIEARNKGITSFILGIVSFCLFLLGLASFWLFVAAPVGLVIGLLGLCHATSANRMISPAPLPGFVAAGKTCSILGVFLNILCMLVWILFFSFFPDIFRPALLGAG